MSAQRVVIVGAGLAGLSGARLLTDSGARVTIVDKGRSVGGRLATRRLDTGGVADHGAQFFTVRGPEMAAFAEDLDRAGLLVDWCHGFDDTPDGHPRYAVKGGMNAAAKWLASSLDDVRLGWPAESVTPTSVRSAHGTDLAADAVIVTSPVPQTIALLDAGGVQRSAAVADALAAIRYEPTLALLAPIGSNRPPLQAPGAIRPSGGSLVMVCDNQAKGASPVRTLTVHASGSWSEAHWNDADDSLVELLANEAAALLGWRPDSGLLKRWRYSTPVVVHPESTLCIAGGSIARGSIMLAGDAFGGPTMEGALRSGLAAARTLI